MTANVLVVDDLEPNVKLLEAKLLNEYYTVFTANNGFKAIEMLSHHKIDVILLDVMMPGMDGFETCSKIKSNPDTAHIPVIMVTALSDIEDRVKGLEAGADEFLTKPVNDTALFARVKSLSRVKTIIDELKLRNQTNKELGASAIEMQDHFSESQILLINDDVIQAKNLIKIIKQLSSNVEVISNISELDKIAKISDLTIISCQLDSGDPLRISMMFKGREDFRYHVLMLLAEDENMNIVMKGMELGVNDYFIYPVDESELIARLKTQLRRKQYQDNLCNELEQSINLSIKDGLTNLFNRRYFDTHIEQMIRNADTTTNNLSLIMIDIDHFKNVNDQYGHQSGDDVLKNVSLILKNTFRVTDLIARYGGEEFAILLGNTKLSDALVVAERARVNVSDAELTLATIQKVLKNTISIGVAEYKKNETVKQFVQRCDEALYKAKDSGRNKVVKAE